LLTKRGWPLSGSLSRAVHSTAAPAGSRPQASSLARAPGPTVGAAPEAAQCLGG
jgi:hypothetical protein